MLRKADIVTLAISLSELVDRGRQIDWQPVSIKEIDRAWEQMIIEVLGSRYPVVTRIFQDEEWGRKVDRFGGMLSRQAFGELYLEALRRKRARLEEAE